HTVLSHELDHDVVFYLPHLVLGNPTFPLVGERLPFSILALQANGWWQSTTSGRCHFLRANLRGKQRADLSASMRTLASQLRIEVISRSNFRFDTATHVAAGQPR